MHGLFLRGGPAESPPVWLLWPTRSMEDSPRPTAYACESIERSTVSSPMRHTTGGSQLDAVPDPDNTASGIWADTSRAAMPRGRECSRTLSSGARVRHREASHGVDGAYYWGWRGRWRRSRSPISPTTRAGWSGLTAEPHPPGLPYSEAVNRISSGSARRQRSSRSAHTAQWQHGVDPRPSKPPTRGV
jgi:hypothetical protein